MGVGAKRRGRRKRVRYQSIVGFGQCGGDLEALSGAWFAGPGAAFVSDTAVGFRSEADVVLPAEIALGALAHNVDGLVTDTRPVEDGGRGIRGSVPYAHSPIAQSVTTTTAHLKSWR